MAAAVVREDPDAECRADCKTVHRRLHAQTLCAKRTRTLAAQKRSEASNSCLAAFNRGVTDECFDSCVAAANGAEWHPGARPRDVYDQRGRPCTSAQGGTTAGRDTKPPSSRRGPSSSRPEPEPEPEPEPRRRLPERRRSSRPRRRTGRASAGARAPSRTLWWFSTRAAQVPLVVREDQSTGAAAATRCAAERPGVGCVRALGVLAATSTLPMAC